MTTVEEKLRYEIDPREFHSPEFQHDPLPVYKRLVQMEEPGTDAEKTEAREAADVCPSEAISIEGND